MKILVLISVLFSTSLLAEEKNIFTVLDIPDEFSKAKTYYPKYINVFGLHIFASKKVRNKKIIHAANILAEYLDNDEDGMPDNQLVHEHLLKRKACLLMSKNNNAWESDYERFWDIFGGRCRAQSLQSLYDVETNPGGGKFDASLEEILHLITGSGYASAYPNELGYKRSLLTYAMDRARGGKFLTIPKKYPKEAWYSYYDRTCSYECMAAEYIYWALTSYLGAQKKRYEILREWRAYTKEKLIKMDPHVTKLITNPKFKFPTKLPDGHYNASVNAYKTFVSSIKEYVPKEGEVCDWIILEAYPEYLNDLPSINFHSAFYVVVGDDERCEYGYYWDTDRSLEDVIKEAKADCNQYRLKEKIKGECKPYDLNKEIVWDAEES